MATNTEIIYNTYIYIVMDIITSREIISCVIVVFNAVIILNLLTNVSYSNAAKNWWTVLREHYSNL